MIDEAANQLRWDTVGSRLDERGRALVLRRPRCGQLIEAVWRLSQRSPGTPVRRSTAARQISMRRRYRRGNFAAAVAGVAPFAIVIRGFMMKQAVLADWRNIYRPEELPGFAYHGIGRGRA